MADINKEVSAFAFASNFSSNFLAFARYAMFLFICVLAKARKIASKSKCYLFINMSQ
jgi:flagellar biosynthesis protein FliR